MKFTENENTELKEIYILELKKEVVAFANTNGGEIFVGINDDGEVVGVDNIDETMLKITDTIRDSIKPDVMMFVSVREMDIERKNIIKISISEGTRKPYYLSDKGMKSSGVYVRQGTSKVNASEDAIRNMIKVSDGDKFESNRSLEQDLTFETLTKEMKVRNLEFGNMQKKNLGILSQDGIITNLGQIVSEQCKYSIKLAVFQGTDKTVFKSRKEFTGSIFSQLNDAYYTIDLHNNTKATFNDLIRVDHKDYPPEAIREALLNAIIHRDYSFSGSISINIYSDRMEIISLGGLVAGLSIEAVMMGASQARNEKLANLFYRMELIESYGIGIGKIMSLYKESEAKPIFDNAQGAFRVTFPNMNIASKVLTESQKKVVEYLEINSEITRSDIEKLLNIKTTRANTIIKELLSLGIILKISSGKNSKYVKA
ncbi:MAG: putative DNA binding domain-containing protein [Clostridia bacterium]